MSVVERIKQLCKENKITLAELERSAGIGNGIIARWKTSSPKTDSLKKVAEHFNVSVDWLIGKSDVRQPLIIASTKPDAQYNATQIKHRMLIEKYESLSGGDEESRRRKEAVDILLGLNERENE